MWGLIKIVFALLGLSATAGVLSMSGCITQGHLQEAQAKIAALEVSMTAVTQAASVYTALPACPIAHPSEPCADPVISAEIQNAATTAWGSILDAEKAVRAGDPNAALIGVAVAQRLLQSYSELTAKEHAHVGTVKPSSIIF